MKSSASCANCAKPGDQCPAATPSHAALAPKDVRRVKAIALLARVPKAIDRTVIGRPRIGPKERVPTAIGRWDQVEVEKVVVVKGEAARDSAAEALADQALDQEDRDLADPAALVAVDSALADRVKVARVKAGREKALHANVDRTAKIGPMATGPAKVAPRVQIDPSAIDLSATGPMRARMLSQKPNQRFPRRGTFHGDILPTTHSRGPSARRLCGFLGRVTFSAQFQAG
jgi:hypothetical protein